MTDLPNEAATSAEATSAEAVADEVVADEVTADAVAEAAAVDAAAADAGDGVDVDVLALSDGAYTLFVADFADVDLAWEAYQELKAVDEAEESLQIEGVLVLKRDADGTVEVQKATDHSTRRGLAWGAVGGAVLGVLFPPSILGSAVVLGAAGAGIGKAREVHHRHEIADELGEAIDPGHSGLVALVSDPAAVKVQQALARADRIVQKAVDDVIADDLKAEARAQKEAAKAEATAPDA
ncbi:MAG TPA: DUF1269 domain-containing protein [Candidatus Nanopelagicales bacterium]